MVDGFVDIEKKDLCLFLLNDPVVSEVDDSSTVDEHKHFDFIEVFGFLYSGVEFSVGGDRVDGVENILAFEHFLGEMGGTDSILRVQMESTSTAVKMTMETDEMLSYYCIF